MNYIEIISTVIFLDKKLSLYANMLILVVILNVLYCAFFTCLLYWTFYSIHTDCPHSAFHT